MSINIVIRSLIDNRLLTSSEEIKVFNAAVDELSKIPDNELIAKLTDLYLVFDDNAENIAPLQHLLALIGRFSEQVSLKHLIAATPTLQTRAPEWLQMFYSGVLANSEGRESLRQLLIDLSNKEKESVRQVLVMMKDNPDFDEEPDLQEEIDYVLGE